MENRPEENMDRWKSRAVKAGKVAIGLTAIGMTTPYPMMTNEGSRDWISDKALLGKLYGDTHRVLMEASCVEGTEDEIYEDPYVMRAIAEIAKEVDSRKAELGLPASDFSPVRDVIICQMGGSAPRGANGMMSSMNGQNILVIDSGSAQEIGLGKPASVSKFSDVRLTRLHPKGKEPRAGVKFNRVLAHEIAHSDQYSMTPCWLKEGLAERLSTTEKGGVSPYWLAFKWLTLLEDCEDKKELKKGAVARKAYKGTGESLIDEDFLRSLLEVTQLGAEDVEKIAEFLAEPSMAPALLTLETLELLEEPDTGELIKKLLKLSDNEISRLQALVKMEAFQRKIENEKLYVDQLRLYRLMMYFGISLAGILSVWQFFALWKKRKR